MSGLFKNFDKLISGSQLSKPVNNLLVRNYLYNFNAAIQYRVSGEKLQSGHGRNVFELSLISYQLQRQNNVHTLMLENLDSEQHSKFYNEIVSKSSKNQEYITDALREIQLQFNIGLSETPVSALTSLTSVLGQQKNPEQNAALFNSHIKSQVLEKLQYASLQDLADLTDGLVNMKVFDKTLWTPVLAQIKAKQSHVAKQQEVQLHAWETDTYENPENPLGSNSIFNRQSHTEQYYNDLISGNAGPVAELKRYVNIAFEEVFFRAIRPLFFRTQFGTEFFYSQDAEYELQKLTDNLKIVSQKTGL